MKISVSVLLATVFMFSLATGLHAQTDARVTSIQTIQNQPMTQIRVHVQCKGQPFYGLNASQLALTDNGLPVANPTIVASASSQTRKPFSAVLVLDCSGSMMGTGLTALKAASNALVDFMDSTVDEAEIIAFNSMVTVIQGMTSYKALVRGGISLLNANGATAVWDASYIGVQELVLNAVNYSQAVIVMTDGGDNSSTRLPSEVITYANTHNKRVFTIGLGNQVNGTTLSAISQLTGGLYFQAPSPGDLTTIFLQIASFARRDFDEYLIRYDTPDSKAAKHTVECTVQVCDTVVTGSATRPSIQSATGIHDPASAGDGVTLLSASPNPVHDGILTCHYTVRAAAGSLPVHIRLYDELGRCRAEAFQSPGSGEFNTTLDVSQLDTGIYRLQILAGNQVHSSNVVLYH
jgi:uncharacterized protein YegL